MSSQAIRKNAIAASNVCLLSTVKLKGVNQYTLGTDMLMWDETNSYAITQIAPTFGQVMQGVNGEQMKFRCGEDSICAFDFGLLLSCFTAMSMSQLELGDGVPVEAVETSFHGVDIVWFGNSGVMYGCKPGILVPITSQQAQRACKNEKVELSSFIDSRKFVLTRVDGYFDIDTDNGEGFCTSTIPTSIKRTFPKLFSTEVPETSEDFGHVVDANSPLGGMIATASAAFDANQVVERYKQQAPIASVVVRQDLICEPHRTYTDPATFIGSLCYTDKHDIALAVNMRGNLFVYRPWFNGGVTGADALKVAPSPKLPEFYNVKEECEHIMRYAKSVTLRPLTPAKFDFSVFDAVKTAFFDMSLARLPFCSSFGRIVIPESILVNGLESAAGESVYCIVPVGSIGDNIIVINSEGELEAMRNMPWTTDDYFYDITEVVS